MRAVVAGRSSHQFKTLGAIESPHDDEMGKVFDVGKAEFKLRKNGEDTFGVVFRAEPPGDIAAFFIGAAHVADWAHRDRRLSWHARSPVLVYGERRERWTVTLVV